MKKIGLILILVMVMAMLIYFAFNNTNESQSSILERYDLQDMNVYELVSYFEQKTDEPETLNVGINGEKLLINDHQDSIEILLPDNQFYLSIAPYINQTHPCANHNLITCRGELKNQDFFIEVVNLENNVIIINETVSSENNGFIGIWLPKDIEVMITVTQNQLSASTQVTTDTTSNTCLTTLKLT